MADGGGIFNDPVGELSIVHSTFVGNEVPGGGNLDGGGFTSLGGATLLRSILARNTPTDCAVVPASLLGAGNLTDSCRSDIVLGTDFSGGAVTHLRLGGYQAVARDTICCREATRSTSDRATAATRYSMCRLSLIRPAATGPSTVMRTAWPV